MHSQSRKKKVLSGKRVSKRIRTTLASHHEFPLSLFAFIKRWKKLYTHTKLPLKCSRTLCVCVSQHEKLSRGWRQEMHQLHPIITLCGLTEACVLIMSGRGSIFATLFFASFVYVRTRCQLRSVVPSPNSMVESMADDTEQRSHQLPFVLPAVTLPQTSTRFTSAPS